MTLHTRLTVGYAFDMLSVCKISLRTFKSMLRQRLRDNVRYDQSRRNAL